MEGKVSACFGQVISELVAGVVLMPRNPPERDGVTLPFEFENEVVGLKG